MHTLNDHLNSCSFLRSVITGAAAISTLMHAAEAIAAAPTTAPQVLIAITNSESMDGNTSGAIMVGSGSFNSTTFPGYSFLYSSSSPVSYTIPAGFRPPVNTGSGGVAPYTAACGSYLCDNGQSRLNMTKAAITNVLSSYGSTINFGLYDYKTSSTGVYNTWVYQMSPAGGFTFTTTPSTTATSVPNPCYHYSTAPATNEVYTDCNAIATGSVTGITASILNSNQYMTLAASSDDASVNDVLYLPSGGYAAVFIDWGTVSPANPYATYSITKYNTDITHYSESYTKHTPNNGIAQTSPTNAGYVPFAPQVIYSQRGFGYGGSQDATTGNTVVPMSTDPTTSTLFTSALAPETNSTSTSEIKSVAGQSAIGGLLAGAKSYLGTISHATCQSQYVVLMTDGLPTLDVSGNNWPPLGTTTANAYSLYATFNNDGSFNTSNSQAVLDAIASIRALKAAGINTYVIGLGAGVNSQSNPVAAQLLQAMAIAGGTTGFFAATDSNSLNNAFQVIVQQIYAASSVSAPVAPISVAGGSSLEYALSSTTPAAGHVDAFTVDANGVPSGSAAPFFQAENLMTASNRAAALYSNLNDANKTVTLLPSVDTSAFNLTTTNCVRDVATIISYTDDPNYSGGPCSYLAGRAIGSMLGAFSTQNSARWVGPPTSGALIQKYSTYVAYARSLATRTPMLMFTDEDGFLYAVDAASGALRWGWTSRSLLAQLQNYSTFPAAGYTNGNFTVVDAMNDSNIWGTYVVGSLQSGAEHFSLKLSAAGFPTNAIYDLTVSGTSAGDTSAVTGNAPLRQPPIIAYIRNSAYSIYVVTSAGVSTLYETNVATGATTSTALTFQVSSSLFLDPTTNQLWLGGSDGTVWAATLTTGNATTDMALIQQTGTVKNPATNTALANVQWVAFFKVNGTPYFYAMNSSQLTLFGVASTGWVPLWASTPTAGYVYSGTTWTVSTTVTKLTMNSVVSDMPLVIGGALLVPVYVPGTGCHLGEGYYDLFSVVSGKFPTNELSVAGLSIAADIDVGIGAAYTPSITMTQHGYSLQDGSANCTTLCGSNQGNNSITSYSIGWRQNQRVN